MVSQAYYKHFLQAQRDKRIDIMQILDEVDSLPPIWIIHGAQDTLVPSASSTNFVHKVQRKMPSVPVKLTLRTGDHGVDLGCTVEEDWVREGCEFVAQFWP
ncbi:unnamed protein product [Cercospora beticola]|nr:unnamed protein product [Cercospora beticola]